MSEKHKIIFVCTDNYGRSIIAERCLENYLAKNNILNYEIASAGTNASSDTTGFTLSQFTQLKKLGINNSAPQRTQLTPELAKSADLIIIFDHFHQDWLKTNLNLNAPLFDEIYKNESTPINCKNYDDKYPINEKMIQIVNYIYEATPTLFHQIEKIIKK